jgi:hypothetical protein
MTNEARLIQRNRTTGIAQGNKTAATEEPAAAAKPGLSNPCFVKGAQVMHETPRGRASSSARRSPCRPMRADRLTRCACAQLRRGVLLNRNEVVRTGVAALATLSDKQFSAVTNDVPKLKTGRPAG